MISAQNDVALRRLLADLEAQARSPVAGISEAPQKVPATNEYPCVDAEERIRKHIRTVKMSSTVKGTQHRINTIRAGDNGSNALMQMT